MNLTVVLNCFGAIETDRSLRAIISKNFCRKTQHSMVASMDHSPIVIWWRGDRAVEGARLEIVCTPNKGTGGSNPPLSAIFIDRRFTLILRVGRRSVTRAHR